MILKCHFTASIKQVWLSCIATVEVSPEMLVGQFGGHTSAGSAFEESFHDEERLIDLLQSAGVLAYCGGDG